MVKFRNYIRLIFIHFRVLFYNKVYGMDISRTVRISLKARLDKTYPRGIHVGENSYIAAGAIVLSHDFTRNIHTDTYIGSNSFIGMNAIILPGIKIGDSVIIGSGSVVTKNIPNNCIAAGNPARILKENINTKRYGQLS